MEKLPAVIALCVLAAAVLGAAIVAYRREQRAELEHDEPGRLADVLPATKEPEHEWSAAALAEVRADPDPLDTTVPLLAGEDMVPAYTFADLMALHPVPLDYPEISFTSEWQLAGARLAEMGDTQTMPAVAA